MSRGVRLRRESAKAAVLFVTIERKAKRSESGMRIANETPNNTKDEVVANRIIGLLPERYSKWLERKFPRSNYDDANSRIQTLTSSAMPRIQEIHALAVVKERGSLQYKIDQAARVRDLMENKLKLDERVDSRTDKAIRRLAQLKTLRQVIGLQVPQAKSIEHDGTSA
jgi:hypothetical protein